MKWLPLRMAGQAGLLTLALAVQPTQASHQRQPVDNPRSLLEAAIDSPDGKAWGSLVGPRAAAIQARFQAPGPIQIDVATERRLPQPGCSRLSVRFWQDQVRLPGVEPPARRSIEFGIDYCRDGHPPAR